MYSSTSKKRGTIKWIIGFVVLIMLFILIQTIAGNPYFKWYFNSLYSIPSATIHHQMLPDGKITGIFDFLDSVHINTIYQHPPVQMVQSGNRFTFITSHFPPESFAEVRFIADPTSDFQFAVANPTLTIEEIKQIESIYTETVHSAWLPWVVLLIVFGFLFFLIFWFMGKEHVIPYQGIYERELPSNDPPDFVNAMVKNLAGKVDKDGIAAAMMNLYHKDYIDFKEIQNRQGVLIKKNEPGHDLSHSEGLLLKLLARFATDNVFDFQDMQKRLSKSTTEASNFNQLLSGYENAVHDAIAQRRYFSTSGNVLAKFIAVVMMFFSLAVVGISSQGITSFLLPQMTILSAIMWFSGGAILLIRKDFFGRWSKEGKEYYQKWMNFSRFLSDFSLLSEYPPESIIIWEKYLVYGTALGVAEKVIQTLQKFIPREI